MFDIKELEAFCFTFQVDEAKYFKSTGRKYIPKIVYAIYNEKKFTYYVMAAGYRFGEFTFDAPEQIDESNKAMWALEVYFKNEDIIFQQMRNK